MKFKPASFIILTILSIQAFSQKPEQDTIKTRILLEPYHRNVIKINPTATILFEDVKNLTFSYERLIKKDQSLAFQAGYLWINHLLPDTIAGLINLTGNTNHQGINLAFDYRYYPGIRNKRPAPDGMFIGGYASYYGIKFDNSFDILETSIDQNGNISGTVNVINLGFDLGYQFVFWKRLTIDLLVFGPSLCYTQGKGNITGDLDQEQLEEIDDELIQKINDKFPLISQIFSEGSLTFSGSRSKFDLGFRYSIQIGFHF